MANTWNGTSLDEVQFRRPEVIQWWGGVHQDSVHAILRESPFFDHTTKNGLLWKQTEVNPHMWELVRTRQALETRLKQTNGVEYMIVGEPQPNTDPALGPDTGIWVIRKQDRRKRPPQADEITVLGTYYLVGENLYQAPSVYDIVGNHLLSAMNSLTKFAQSAAPLPLYTPATGYTYFPPTTTKTLAASQALSSTSREASTAPTPADVPAAAATLDSAVQSKTTQDADPRAQMALFESFNMMLHYGDEYMDENPLRGEPGNFTFSATKHHVRAKAEAAEAAKVKEAELAKKLEEARLAAQATPFASAAAKKDDEEKTKKKVRDKIKKRRSKGLATNPSTPASPATPAS
ncbi:MED6-domain-containing protein [Aureobasidium pullulans]|uniref:Mediator of RNA polymerase II transcription subunit 6 n=1 Tax=Aureobasidium pullulans TaxID=5580 RepID=A0A4T0C4J6_AURPU|nr:MED6-domain-containing protein [Aureobasidium pullulans]